MIRPLMIGPACAVELLKLRRSNVIGVTTVVLLVVPALMASIFAHAAARSGADPVSIKARALVAGTGWDGYISGVVQVLAPGGFLGMGVAVAWCFGREHADRTVVSLYASATSRGAVATAKLVVLAGWIVTIAFALVPSVVIIGLISGLGPPDAAALTGLARIALLAALTGSLALTVAVFATMGRGYLPAIGALIGLLIAAQIAVVTGVGAWFPLSSPGLWAAQAAGLPAVATSHLLLVPVLSLIVAVGTVIWTERAPLV